MIDAGDDKPKLEKKDIQALLDSAICSVWKVLGEGREPVSRACKLCPAVGKADKTCPECPVMVVTGLHCTKHYEFNMWKTFSESHPSNESIKWAQRWMSVLLQIRAAYRDGRKLMMVLDDIVGYGAAERVLPDQNALENCPVEDPGEYPVATCANHLQARSSILESVEVLMADLEDAFDILIEEEGLLDAYRESYKLHGECMCTSCRSVRLFKKHGRL